ncbi:MAG: M12 family metallo-peptidase, partial [Holophagales bacterium]|nr:M12 family metallo-peptidase [Holophagales bacterium]
MNKNLCACLFLCAVAFTAAAAWAQPAELYRISSDKARAPEPEIPIAGAVEQLELELDTSAIDAIPEELTFPLPDGRRLTAVRTQFDAEPDLLSWAGHIRGSGSSHGFVHLIDRGDHITGMLNVGSEQFQIVPYEHVHRLVRVELGHRTCFFEGEDHPHEAGEIHPDWLAGVAEELGGEPAFDDREGRAPAGAQSAEVGTKESKSVVYIDLLAVYPNAFSGSAETGVRQYIQNSVSQANVVLASSNVNARFRLVAREKLIGPDQPPATGLLDGIQWMTPTQVGNQNVDLLGPQEVLDLRDEYAADMVALFLPLSYDDTNACGIANIPEKDGDIRPYHPSWPSPGDFGKRAYTVQRDGCGFNDFTLVHELGHNFGMRHNTHEDTSTAQHLFPNG